MSASEFYVMSAKNLVSQFGEGIGHMATECTEYWKIKGNILKKTHVEVMHEKKEEDTVGFYRRLSKRSFILEQDLKSSLHKRVQGLQVPAQPRRASFLPPENMIVEESENSSESSELKSKSPTSSSNSDSNSSFNIFGIQSSSNVSDRDQSKRPFINVNQFSSKNIQPQGILKKNSVNSRRSSSQSHEDFDSISSKNRYILNFIS